MILLLLGPRPRYAGLARGLEEEGHEVRVDTETDLSSMPAVRSAVAAAKPRAVILAAGWDDIEAAEDDEARAFAENAEAGISVAAAALEFDAVPVLVSSAEVFGQSGGPWSEADTPTPLSTLAQSKLRGESFMTRAAPRALVVRVGPVLEDGLGDLAAALQDDIEAPDDELVSPIGAVDLGRALRALLDAEVRGVVHVANAGAPVSRAELLRRAARALGIDEGRVRPVAGRSLSRRAEHARAPTLHTDRLSKVLEAPLRSWLAALEEAGEAAPEAPPVSPTLVPGPAVEAQVFTPHPEGADFGTRLALARAEDHHADLLRLDAGKPVAARRHRMRTRTVHVLDGKVLLEVGAEGAEQDHVLRPGRSVEVPPGTRYRLVAVEGSQVLLVWAGGDDDTELLP